MSKTTPEEALQRATKHRINLMYSSDFVKLAALIDEVRGVDAEPSITVHKDASGVVWLNFVAPSGTKAMLSLNNVINDRSNTFTTRAMADAINAYTHPAPSQPAAPVELPVVMNKITPPPAYACIRRASGEDKCSRWCGDSAKCIASPMLEEAKAAIKLRYTGQGAASEPESTNPYRAGSNAALYWQAGHDAAQSAIAAGRKAS